MRVVARGFVAAVVARNGVVVEAAPILKFMRGWSGRRFHEYTKQKGWTWTIVS